MASTAELLHYTDDMFLKLVSRQAEPAIDDIAGDFYQQFLAGDDVIFDDGLDDRRVINRDNVDGDLMDDIEFMGQLFDTLRDDPIEAARIFKEKHNELAYKQIRQAVDDFTK